MTILLLSSLVLVFSALLSTPQKESSTTFKLPAPKLDGDISVEKAISLRRSIRSYKKEALSIEEVSQILWAAQGITNQQGYRTAPSAGALFPLELYIAVGNVKNLSPGIYKYNPQKHELMLTKLGDKRNEIADTAGGQDRVRNGAVVLIFSAVYERTKPRYGTRTERYVHMEIGHAAQNVYLQVTALNLATVSVGAFVDNQLKKVSGLERNEIPLLLMPVGKK